MHVFIRYISHELRTPLNTMHIGLEILKNSILLNTTTNNSNNNNNNNSSNNSSSSNQNKDTYDILTDILNSCRITEWTLDNLLTYNAIKSNTLSLNKTNVNIWKYLKTVVKQFPNKVYIYICIDIYIIYIYIYILYILYIYISYVYIYVYNDIIYNIYLFMYI